MRKNRAKFLWALLPKIPFLLRTLVMHVLGVSEVARYLDLETNMTLTVLRSAVSGGKPRAIGATQAMSILDPGVKGKVWISNAVSEVPPERGIREALMAVIKSLSDLEAQEAGFKVPEIARVEAEWTGYRAGAAHDEPLPDIPEEQKYDALMKECKNATTVLYFHGGAYFLCDPSTHRVLAKRLAKATGGRVYSVRYRLAPQHPFPAALLDALVSYFTLLYPPPGSMHEAVSPRDIVFGGDSAGGNLTLALTQALLQLRRLKIKIPWFGMKRDVPMPAGLALFSPWIDMVQSFPSWSANAKWDYLPPPDRWEASPPPSDAIWPATPPRKHLYVDDALRLHPLVSLQLNASWAGTPPVWMCFGWECLADEDRYFAAKLRRDGVRVALDEFEAMPHVFALVLPKLAETERCVRGVARFITATRKEPERIVSSYTYIKAKTLEESEGDVEKLTPYGEKEVFAMAYGKVGREAPLSPILAGPKL
ncbi:alpha/beta hydrolase fold-domain-containing protein [Xylaria bambusicola]|uniref:alpha/beta hydrolase fold-domain-containing protein n=1 Tax=Xylaria bambusicola TaxID=326684 RepID=UPI002008EB81|nr:alpha/beta hydrolase fold-domain-containing protein [Xylaria bambusicola]KAI0505498.1 alpha/beta hydrolase fold-domain-containing protein [Xylaria bambusicola]